MKGSKVLAVIIAACGVAVAGGVIYNSIAEQNARNAMLPPVYKAPAGARPAVSVSHFDVPAIKPREFRSFGPASALALNAREPELSVIESNCSILLRELARQAVLISAREGLRLPTRDCTLREGRLEAVLGDDAVSPDAKVLEIGTAAIKGKSLRIWVRGREKNGSAAMLIDTEVALAGDPKAVTDYAAVTHSLELLSRGLFETSLRKAGYSAPPPQTREATAREVDDIEKRLGVLSLVSQYSALRQAHASIQSSGESPRMLGALVRGYANLGSLTQFLWNASHKDFAARSLLYAERMVDAAPESPDALRHRGYARAMAGLHALALADLDEADRLDRGDGAPGWASLIRDLCRYDTAALSDAIVKRPADAPLASYLCFLTVENCRSESAMMGFGKVAMGFNPLCLRVLDAMCGRAGVISGHTLTQIGPAILAQSLATELPAVPGLPQSVRQTLPTDMRKWGNPNTTAEVADALVGAADTDSSDPSWAVLGRMAQEAQFVHVWRRAAFLRDKLAVDASDFVAESRPLVADHPCAAMIESYAPATGDDSIPGINGLKDMDIVDVEPTERPLRDLLGRVFTERHGGTVTAGYGAFWMDAHADDLAWEIEDGMHHPPSDSDAGAPDPLTLARRADVVSPFMPAVVAARIEADWPHVAPNIEQIERDSGTNPDVGAALARQYQRLGRTDDVIRVLHRYLKVAPDYWAFEMLAQSYLNRGDEPAWLATLEKALEQEDYALNHSEVNERIALHFLDAGRYDRAEPYARASARSGADWALGTAAQCFEGLGKWDDAEKMTRDAALRYGQPVNWYMWCVKTGHGHIGQASKLMDEYVAATTGSNDPAKALDAVHYLLGQGKTNEAMTEMRRIADETGDPWTCLHAALWCAATKDEKGCDGLLNVVTRRGPSHPIDGRFRPGLVKLATLFQTCRAGGAAKLDLDKVEQGLAHADESEFPSMLYFTGKFLEIRGDEADARRYYARCLATHGGGGSNRMLAAMELRKRGIDPMDLQKALPATAPVPAESPAR